MPYISQTGGTCYEAGGSLNAALVITATSVNVVDAASGTLAAIEARLGKSVATRIEPVGDTFHAAEEYHQDYYPKNPLRYRYYRYNCSRDRRPEQVWGQETEQ